MIARRALLAGADCALRAEPSGSARAQAPRRKRIGWRKIQDRNHTPGQLAAFLAGWGALGHEEGRSFAMEYRFADGDASRLPALAADPGRAAVDMILATSQPATDAARRATLSIPIIGRMTGDPVSAGSAIAPAGVKQQACRRPRPPQAAENDPAARSRHE